MTCETNVADFKNQEKCGMKKSVVCSTCCPTCNMHTSPDSPFTQHYVV